MDGNNKLLSRDELLGGTHLKKAKIEVPELGGYVFLRELSAEQAIAFNAQLSEWKEEGKKETTPEMSFILMNMLVVFSVCDESGKLIFQPGDHPAIQIEVMSRMTREILRLSGMDESVGEGLTSEVASNLKNDQPTSLSSS